MKVYGPYISGTIGRRFVNRIFDDGTRKTTSYARYLMEQALGRELTPEETVDHIDGDPMNDVIDNLAILTLQENIAKSARPIEWYEFICPVCNGPAKKRARDVRGNHKKGKSGPYCSRSCAGKAPHVGV